ncbi:carboxylesterase/lipase family protein [Streptomyces sp. NPDC051561]|uniref:carboxylesterase/lipase family protein n=1 Tax=Streptomyces sp. NPDC051561 TaxID=3365658 RepID=UPI0037B1B597
MASVDVRTDHGVVRGRSERGLAVFRGIPYAQPPVGELRFAAPRPPEPWEDVREADAFGPPSPQSIPLPGIEPAPGDGWLTANVWTPLPDPAGEPGSDPLPVLVWIHGGAYVAGSSSDPMYDGADLARQGLVVITVNYRVGAEGWAHVEGAPDNRGLLDQLAALTWVRDNIGAFGGDPDRVTVCGQSAGAGSIATLLVSPPAAGLFHRAIAQSVPGMYCTPAFAADFTAALAERLGVAPTVAGLGALAPQQLADEIGLFMRELPAHGDRWGRAAHLGAPLAPVLDGVLVPQTPWQALRDGRTPGVELLTGHTKDEFRMFLLMTGRTEFTDAEADAALTRFAPLPEGPAAYRAGLPSATPFELFDTVHADTLFRMPTAHLAEANAAAGAATYLYELTWPAPSMGGVLGSCHALEVPLLFGTFDSPAARMVLGDPTDEARALAEDIRDAWVAFAKSGDPGWTAYHPHHGRNTRVFDGKGSAPAVPYPEEVSRRIWEGAEIEPFGVAGE